MGMLDELGGILKQYSSGATSGPPKEVHTHFDQVAAAVPPGTLADGVSHAMRSDQTPDFGQLVSSLFAKADDQQKAAMLNQLASVLGPDARAALGGALGGALGAGATVTPQQAQQLSPDAVKGLADRAQSADESIVDRMGGFYAQHPQLVKAMGAGALALIMSRLADRR